MQPLRAGLILAIASVLLVAGCGSVETSPGETGTATPSTTAAGGSSSRPSASGAASGTPARSSGPTTRPSGSATPRPSAAVSTAAPSGSVDPTSCAGSDANRAFFRDVAASVAWDVYCPTLPKGWFVESGNFRAASGGSMVISYRTTAGLRFELKEGLVCTGTVAECGPLDSTIGTAAFGDRQGQLGTHSGDLVLYVSPGVNPAWQATGTGLDQATFRAICGALLKVAG